MSEKSSSEKKFYLLDLDRCMLNTPLASNVYAEVIREQNPALAAQMLTDQQETEDRGGSFDLLRFLEARIGEDEIDALSAAFIKKSKNLELLNPGAVELLYALEKNRAYYGIFTYGHEKWQTVKLQASGLDKIPYLITPEKHKGTAMTSWKQEDGTFVLPPELILPRTQLTDEAVLNLGTRAIFQSICEVDDKAVSFEGIPEGVEGYWTQLYDTMIPSQMGTVPPSVQTVKSFGRIVAIEFGESDSGPL